MPPLTTAQSGLFSAGTTWTGGVAPADGEGAIINHDITFDVDMTAWTTGLSSLLIQAVFSISQAVDTYLKMSLDITGSSSGIYRALLSSGGINHTVDFNGGSNSFDCSGGLVLDIQCQEPTNQYASLDIAALAVANTLFIDTDLTGDGVWELGDTIHVDNANNARNSEEHTIAQININNIVISGTLAGSKEIGTKVILMTRNIRIINSTDYAIKNGTGSRIDAEIHDCPSGMSGGYDHTVGGSINTTTYGVYNAKGLTLTGAISGCSYAVSSSKNVSVAGILSGNSYGVLDSQAVRVLASGIITGSTRGFGIGGGHSIYGEVSGCTYGVLSCTLKYFSGVWDNLYNFTDVTMGKGDNTLFVSGSEVLNYNSSTMPLDGYLESRNHDQVAGAFIAWTRGGTVKMKTTDPAPGQTFAYKHSNGEEGYVCFKQDERIIEAGETLLVKGYLKILTDQSDYAPRVEIISPATDPLVESSHVALASATIPTADGTDTDWQAVELNYENTTGKAMPVLVRTSSSDAAEPAWSFIEEEIMGLEELQADVDTLLAGVITLLAGVNITKIGGDTTTAARLAEAVKFIVNKTTQNKVTGVITVFDNDGTTPILTITPTDDGSTIAKARS